MDLGQARAAYGLSVRRGYDTSASWRARSVPKPRAARRVTDVSRIRGTRRIQEDTSYVGFGTVRPRVQTPGPRPVFEPKSPLTAEPYAERRYAHAKVRNVV